MSLRGPGSTGASRTLLLWDGVPANSPFGGWVYWTRLDPERMERIEVTHGAPLSVFGDKATGGAIALFSREPQPRAAWLGYEGGNAGTRQLSGGAESRLARHWALGGSARLPHGWIFRDAGRGARRDR